MKQAWLGGLWVGVVLGAFAAGGADAPELIACRRIWNESPHSAFTDLVRHRREWICVFREGKAHVSSDGAVRVLVSRDGVDWTTAAVLRSPAGDLRDPKVVESPGGRLMLTAAVAYPPNSTVHHRTLVWFSRDARTWTEPVEVGDPDQWLWRVTWRRQEALGIGYDTRGENFVRLYRTTDGTRFETLVPTLFDDGHPNESSIVFEPDGAAVCLLRRDGTPRSGQLGRARPPYREWQWTDLGVRIGGPQLLRLPDGRHVAAVRLYDGAVRTSLAWLDPEAGKLTEFLKLPSGGDTSYAGLAWHRQRLYVSYYSSHEGRTAIYFAEVKLPRAKRESR